MTSYIFIGRDFPGLPHSHLNVYSHKGLVYSHKGKTRDALKGSRLADHDRLNDINDVVLFERTDRWPSM